MLQELFYYYRYAKKGPRKKRGMKALYLAFMDLAKAFDTVPRKLLFQKLKKAGITGKMLRVIQNLYTSNRASVRIDNYESEIFSINSGVMHGSKLGPILFNVFINDLLEELHNSKLGAKMGQLIISALGFADDVALIADTPENLQKLIDICSKWSSDNGMSFNIAKCKILVLNKSKKGLSFNLGGTEIEKVNKIRYLGVIWSRSRQTSLYTSHINTMFDKAETKVNAIRHMGFHSDGLRPITAMRMYKILVRPILEYAAQVLSYSHYYLKEGNAKNIEEPTSIVKIIEIFQNRVLKKLIPCPKRTPPAILRLMTGTVPMGGRLEKLKLRNFWRVQTSTEDTIAHRIYTYRRKNFLQSNKGYVHEVFNLCCKYGRMDIWHGLCPNKVNPYIMIKRMVQTYHYDKDVEKARRTTCQYTSLTDFTSGGPLLPKTHSENYKFDDRFRKIGQFKDSKHRRLFLYAFLDTGGYEKKCNHCGDSIRDLTDHALTECRALVQLRYRFKLLMKFYDAPASTSFKNKDNVFALALTKYCFMKALTEFLEVVGELK